MSTRWFLIDRRYFSLSVRIGRNPDIENLEPFAGYFFDLSLRPIFIIHIVSLWTGPFRCFHFAILFTSFPNFEYSSDIYETDESCVYPAPGYAGSADLIATVWKHFFPKWVTLVTKLLNCCYRSLLWCTSL